MDNELEAAWDRLFAFCESRGAETKRIGGKFRLFFPDTGLTACAGTGEAGTRHP